MPHPTIPYRMPPWARKPAWRRAAPQRRQQAALAFHRDPGPGAETAAPGPGTRGDGSLPVAYGRGLEARPRAL